MKKLKIRTQYLIYPKFQFALIGANLIAWVTFVTTMFAVISASNSEIVELGRQANLPADHVYFRFIQMQSKTLIAYTMAGSIIALVLTSIFFIWFSHRLVGPLFNLNRYLKAVHTSRLSGQPLPPPLKFRQNDFFQELAHGVNKVVSEEPIEKKRAAK